MKLKNLKTNFLGKINNYYEQIDSTQNEIWRLAKEEKLANGTLIMAGIQTDGKGTHGRKWYTDTTNNIACSFYIELNCNIKKIEGITIEIAEILVSIIKEKYNIEINIKEPNDLVYNNKKIGGILSESKTIGETVKFLVVGIGINTSQEVFNKDIENIASSIKNEFGVEVNREEIITEFCNRFEEKILKRIGN